MEHIYPKFEKGRILRQEALWALRDYSYEALALRYQNYSDGVISGCELRAEDSAVVIAPGILKCGGFIFLKKEPERIPVCPAEKDISLKFRLKGQEQFADFIRYTTETVLDETTARGNGEIELCRFKLKKGSVLRSSYKDFYDIQTEYDTLNLADSTWSGAGGAALNKYITDYYAREIMKCPSADAFDLYFAGLCLQSGEAVCREALEGYIQRKSGGSLENDRPETADQDADEFGKRKFRQLKNILENIKAGRRIGKDEPESRRQMIVMD